MMRNRARAFLGVSVVAGLVLTGCAPSYDNVLAQQLVMDQADPFGRWMRERLSSIEIFETGLRFLTDPPDDAPFLAWNGGEAPAGLSPDHGAVVVYNVTGEITGDFRYETLYFSGPADREGSAPWGMARSLYTCDVQLMEGDGTSPHKVGYLSREERVVDCPEVLVEALGDGALYVPPDDFAG